MSDDALPEIRLELQLKNNRLWHAVHAHHASVAEFCRATMPDLPHANVSIGAYLSLKKSPFKKRSDSRIELKDVAKRLVLVTKIPATELFPEELYEIHVDKPLIAEVSTAYIKSLGAASKLALPAGQIPAIEAVELKETLLSVLNTLTPREQNVLRWYYGLECESMNQLQIAEKLGLSRARVYQLLLKAMRKMRHPSRSRRLRPFLEE